MQGLLVLDKLESMRSQFRAGPLPPDANKAYDALWTKVEQETMEELQKTVLNAEKAGLEAGGYFQQGKWVESGIAPESKMWSLENPLS